MSALVIKVLQEIETTAKQFAAAHAPPRTALGRFRAPPKLAQDLSAALSEFPVLATPNLQHSTWTMTGPFAVPNMAAALIERVIDGTPSTEALNDLVELVSNKTADIYALKAVAGISVKEVAELDGGVMIMPAECAPPSFVRENMFDIDRHGARIYRGSIVTSNPPQTALIIRGRMTVIHNGEQDWKAHKKLTAHIVSKQERALTSLTLSGPECAPYVVSGSSWIDHPAYPYSGFGGGGFGTHHGVSPVKLGAADTALATSSVPSRRPIAPYCCGQRNGWRDHEAIHWWSTGPLISGSPRRRSSCTKWGVIVGNWVFALH